MKISFGLLIFIVCIFLFISCTNKNNGNDIKSGTIEYKIRYLNNHLDEREASLLPENMKLIFNEDLAVNYIDGFLGLYKLNTITNFDTRKCSTLLKVFEKQYMYYGKKGEYMCCFDEMEDMQIRETNETRIIAGLKCRRAIITLPSDNKQFDIYYTTDIDLRHPNMNNPYKKINGVLMQFELQLLHLRMEFTAVKFNPDTDRGIKLNIPKNISQVTRDQMTQILNKLME